MIFGFNFDSNGSGTLQDDWVSMMAGFKIFNCIRTHHVVPTLDNVLRDRCFLSPHSVSRCRTDSLQIENRR
jgi:hypothetical protein